MGGNTQFIFRFAYQNSSRFFWSQGWVNLRYRNCDVGLFLKRHRKLLCGEMCIWVVRVRTKTPGYPCPRQKFTKRIFSHEKFPPTHTALGFANIRPKPVAGSGLRAKPVAGRSCRDSMLVRVDGSKNELVAIQINIKTFLHALFSTLRSSVIIIIIVRNVSVMFATPWFYWVKGTLHENYTQKK